MMKGFLALLVVMIAIWLQRVSAQKAASGAYMQIFYEGPGWLAGRRVLSYSPAFRGKTEEVVQEPDSVRRLSPDAFLERDDDQTTTTKSYGIVSTDKGTFVPDATGKMHLETAADHQLARQREMAQRNRGLKLLETRADLGKATLAKSLNEATADGWEVAHLTSYGAQGGLVYLLKHR